MQFPTRAWNQVSQASFKVGNCFKTSDKFRTGNSVWWMSEIYFFSSDVLYYKFMTRIWLATQSNSLGVWHFGFKSSQRTNILLKLVSFNNLIVSLKTRLTWEGSLRDWHPEIGQGVSTTCSTFWSKTWNIARAVLEFNLISQITTKKIHSCMT